MNAQKMKAVVATKYGSPDFIEIQNVEVPVPKENEMLIKVKATTVTKADTMMRTATPFISRFFLGFFKPKNPITGTGFSGEIVEVGNAVSKFKVGDEIYGETGVTFSANAEYICLSENAVVDFLPKNFDHEEAATITDGSLTSFNFLKNIGEIKKGQTVLIIGASGSLGTAAVQLVKYFGAHATAVNSEKNKGLVTMLGADEVIDYKTTEVAKLAKKYDLIYDTVGAGSFSKYKNILTENGIYMSPVLGGKLLLEMIWTNLFSKKKAKFSATGMLPENDLREYLKELKKIIEDEKLEVVIDTKYSLDNAAEAHRYVDTGRKVGNVVLLP